MVESENHRLYKVEQRIELYIIRYEQKDRDFRGGHKMDYGQDKNNEDIERTTLHMHRLEVFS